MAPILGAWWDWVLLVIVAFYANDHKINASNKSAWNISIPLDLHILLALIIHLTSAGLCKMPFCAVGGCTSSSHQKNVEDISFHCFPKDKHLQKIWMHRCGRQDVINPGSATICSRHFRDSDFSKFHQFRVTTSGSKQKRRIETGAVPSLNLPKSSISK